MSLGLFKIDASPTSYVPKMFLDRGKIHHHVAEQDKCVGEMGIEVNQDSPVDLVEPEGDGADFGKHTSGRKQSGRRSECLDGFLVILEAVGGKLGGVEGRQLIECFPQVLGKTCVVERWITKNGQPGTLCVDISAPTHEYWDRSWLY